MIVPKCDRMKRPCPNSVCPDRALNPEAVTIQSRSFGGGGLTWDDSRIIFMTKGAAKLIYAHELGHALGYEGHSEEPKDLMYPIVFENVSQRITKSVADVANP